MTSWHFGGSDISSVIVSDLNTFKLDWIDYNSCFPLVQENEPKFLCLHDVAAGEETEASLYSG